MKQITSPLRQNDRGENVLDLHDCLMLLLEKRVIQVSEEEGQFFIGGLKREREEQIYSDVTAKLVAKFQEQFAERFRLAVTAEVDAPTADALNSFLKELGALEVEPQGGAVFEVKGKVASQVRAGVGGLRVEIVDKNVGPDVRLVETVTDAEGIYRVTFSITGLQARCKQRPDLQARAFTGEIFLGASDVRYNASNSETLNILLTETASTALASEHETLIGVLAASCAGSLRDLQETDDRQDITFLANKTGWDARAVALAALADQFSAKTAALAGTPAIPPAFFYALFRAGLPANEESLYHTNAQTLEAVWKSAAEQGVIPKAVTDQIPSLIAQFQVLSAQKLLTAPALVGASSLKEMLITSRLDDAQQTRFTQLYAEHRGDLPTFWKAAANAFGENVASHLQVDGKLGFLTINNAPLTQKVHAVAGADGLSDPLQLAQLGYHRADAWGQLLTEDIPIPKEVTGDTPELKRVGYANYLAAQVRLSYPTAAVAQMVKSRELSLTGAADDVADQVHAFLTEHQGKFEIGVHPVQQFLAQNNVQVATETLQQVKRLQRVYQITPSDQALTGLMRRGIDSASHVVSYDRDTFVQTFAADLGGADDAALTYDKSVQIHNAVLNITLSYLHARTAPAIGVHSPPNVLDPVPAHAGDVIAMATMESLFDSMDFCECEHCRSILSPAAYLVDLLLFLDRPDLPDEKNPQSILLARRPDIQHLALTCGNTNTALPYIDVVNETLEYYIANGLTLEKRNLDEYRGHDTSDIASEDLLASPQFVVDAAYTTLRNDYFPAPLPFHQPLENLRRYFNKFEVPLPLAMERLRKNDDLERGANPYGWRDILMEQIGFSRAEYEILTGAAAVPLWQMYGFPNGMIDADVIAELSNAKQFCRRVGISYDELVAVLKTRFVNPSADLIPKLERLGVAFANLKALKDGTITDNDFDKLVADLAVPIDPAQYDNDPKKWVKDEANYARIMGLILLTDTSADQDTTRFDTLEFRYAKPMTSFVDESTRLGAVEFVRLLRFVRLWKKLGWTIDQTDAAICALYRADLAPLDASDIDDIGKLNTGFQTLLPRLGVVVRVSNALNLTIKRDLLSLLACWSSIGTYGDAALYRQMFLNPALLKQDAVFADNGYGQFLTDSTKTVASHAEALRSAFNLSADEYDLVVAALGYNAATVLTIPNVSAIYRSGWLARKLKISVRELLLLIQLTGLDPFRLSDPSSPAILQVIAFVEALKDRSLKFAASLYLIWNQDLSGKTVPDATQIAELVRTLRGDFVSIDDQFAVTEDPGGDIALARMTLVYGAETSNTFFALLDDTLQVDTAYTHWVSALESAIIAAAPGIAYDDFRHRLSHKGLMTTATQTALKNVGGVSVNFQNAVDQLFALGEQAKGLFFNRYPELQAPYNTAIVEPPVNRHGAFLSAFQPDIARKRKCQLALERLSAIAGVDPAFAQAILQPASAPYPLHAVGDPSRPALDDVLALQLQGFAVEFFFRDTATGSVDLSVAAAASLEYVSGGSNSLPNTGNAISGIWRGQIEAPEAGFYNLLIDADAGATVALTLDGQARALTRNGNLWRNTDPIELKAATLYQIVLQVEKVKNALSLKWETPKRTREVIPSRFLYPTATLAPFTDIYVRFLKTTSLVLELGLTVDELIFFATHNDYQINGVGWLNALLASGNPDTATANALFKPFRTMLDFARIKSEISPGDESLLIALKDPVLATQNPDSLMFAITRWNKTSLNDVLTQFGSAIAGLRSFDLFGRVYGAFALIQKMGISANTLIQATTNEPTGDQVRNLQAALRARYEAAEWRDVVRPINDEMRSLQRDALVAYILHQMRAHSESAHIDTADKLFEYFLTDVQMAPCMQTSRIRHALSSVQLFIERCLMNLEPDVSSALINTKQWVWMKRYRVWEANRKVYLFPENWLEPELRDDKSPIFKEIESELLQSDITEDSAASALLNYLAKLEEVAKLEPCGIYHQEGKPNGPGDIDHVIARTAGAQRKYFYRRYEYGYWTPWEQIKLDIEDNPVIPVVWNDRLLLFWLRIIKKAPDTAQTPPPDKNLTELKSKDVPSKLEVTIHAVLCWSEYYNGKWQVAKTSDINSPTDLGSAPAQGPFAFDRSNLTILFSEEGDALRVSFRNSSFLLHNTHSLPQRQEDIGSPAYKAEPGRFTSPGPGFGAASGTLTLDYDPGYGNGDKNLNRDVLSYKTRARVIQPFHPMQKPWDAPFFYEDVRHVFFVTTTEKLVPIYQHFHYGVVTNPDRVFAEKIPPLIVKVAPEFAGKSSLGPPPNIDETNAIPIQRFVTEDVYIRKAIGTTDTVLYGNRRIGPSGIQ